MIFKSFKLCLPVFAIRRCRFFRCIYWIINESYRISRLTACIIVNNWSSNSFYDYFVKIVQMTMIYVAHPMQGGARVQVTGGLSDGFSQG